MKENFGMTVQDITPDIARYLGIASRVGVIVVDVKDGSPADEKGIQPQDIILEVNKVKISSLKDYQREISKKSAKNSILLLIKRGKAKYFVSLPK
jgi:serine protease Do